MTALQTLPCKILSTLLTLILTLLLTLLLTHKTHLSLPASFGLNLNHCPHAPNPPTTTLIFTETPNLKNPLQKTNNPAAAAAATPKWGGLWVQKNETYKQRWGISMFHAMHCLDMIREDGVGGGKGGDHSHEGHDHHHDDHQAEHVEHCFSYIAQTIICAGDGTIEPPWEETDDVGNIMKYGVDGEGYQHECRDTSRLWEASLQSEEQVLELWDWQMGDTVESMELRSQG